jgi:hypothetical protein
MALNTQANRAEAQWFVPPFAFFLFLIFFFTALGQFQYAELAFCPMEKLQLN